MAIGVIAAAIVYLAYNYLSRMRPFRNVDDTLGVVYTHGFAGLVGGLLVGVFANADLVTAFINRHVQQDTEGLVFGGGFELLKWQALAALFVIVFCAVMTFIILRLIKLVVPLRMSEEDMEEGDLAVHGHEVYPSDVPSLGAVN
jgi:Amt family ammonium transporter